MAAVGSPAAAAAYRDRTDLTEVDAVREFETRGLLRSWYVTVALAGAVLVLGEGRRADQLTVTRTPFADADVCCSADHPGQPRPMHAHPRAASQQPPHR